MIDFHGHNFYRGCAAGSPRTLTDPYLDVSVAPNGALCAIRVDRSLTCQGEFAELGWSDDEPSIAPDGEFTQVAVGLHHACAIRVDGAAVCWGHEHDGTHGRDFYYEEIDFIPNPD